MYYKTQYASPLGEILLVADEKALVGLWIEGQKYFLGSFKEEICDDENAQILVKAKCWLDKYFAGEKPQINDLPLSPQGSDFAKSVWKILCEIPYGKTITYGEIAEKIAQSKGIEKMSAQAVGGAVGHNPISIIIPCHRVVGIKGNLTGYAGGIDKKIKLLTHEGVDMSVLYLPKKSTAL